MAIMLDDLSRDPALKEELARRAPELGIRIERAPTLEQMLERQMRIERDRQQDLDLSR
jgi:hypothetical protein